MAATNVSDALAVVEQKPDGIGLTRGKHAWARGSALLRAILGPRICRATSMPSGFAHLRQRISDQQAALLTYSDVSEPSAVQLMGLYHSRGREADATIVVLRGNDYFGQEAEPMPVGTKLLYVVLTRARAKTIVLTLDSPLPRLIYPLAVLSADH